MPASRPAWNGYLKLSFVSCPIALYPATSAADRLSFRQVNRRTGHRLKHKLVDSITGEEVASSEKARGYETARDEFLLVEDRDIAQARNERTLPGASKIATSSSLSNYDGLPSAPAALEEVENETTSAPVPDDENEDEEAPVPRLQITRTIEIERFVPMGQVDARYFEKPYYVSPRGDISQEAFAVIRDAMTREKVVGLARIVLSSRERWFLVEPLAQGLRGITLRFAQEVRSEEEYFNRIPSLKLPAEMMKLAQHIIRSKAAEFDPSMLEDYYRAGLVRILQRKQGKRPIPPATAPSHDNVINLMDALRRSIAAEEIPRKPPATGRAAGVKRKTARTR
jgi:DNA end-binding protein Ku